jgi:uncharacterized membrane protein
MHRVMGWLLTYAEFTEQLATRQSWMAFYEHSVVVNTSVDVVYQQWLKVEEFPAFMEGVLEVRQPADKIIIWRAEIGGVEQVWSAELTDQLPNRRIAWQNTSGAKHIGIVTFFYITSNTTKITLQIEYDPLGFVDDVGAAFGAMELRMRCDLERFKTMVETREQVLEALRS